MSIQILLKTNEFKHIHKKILDILTQHTSNFS
jgi:hypothetical protein